VLLTKYHLGDQIEKSEMGGACGMYGGQERCIQGLVGRHDWKRPFGRPRSRWDDNVKIDLQEVGWGDMNWIDLARDRDRWRGLVNAVMNLREP
jgi:hypothetical protein